MIQNQELQRKVKKITAESEETVAKSDALQEYISNNKKRRLVGGIVINKPSGMFVYEGKKYNKGLISENWKRLRLD